MVVRTLAGLLQQLGEGSRMVMDCRVINCALCCAYCVLWPASITVMERRFVSLRHVSEHICVLKNFLCCLFQSG